MLPVRNILWKRQIKIICSSLVLLPLLFFLCVRTCVWEGDGEGSSIFEVIFFYAVCTKNYDWGLTVKYTKCTERTLMEVTIISRTLSLFESVGTFNSSKM